MTITSIPLEVVEMTLRICRFTMLYFASDQRLEKLHQVTSTYKLTIDLLYVHTTANMPDIPTSYNRRLGQIQGHRLY